jgi:hypothetical protein
MYMVPCHLPHSVVVCIMSFLLMITQENVGSISLKLKVTHLISSESIKPLLKSRQRNTSKPLSTDKGGEFESLQFEDFYKEVGIKR